MSAWVIGPTKGLLAASRDGTIPPVFQMLNQQGAPVVILILQGLIFTALSTLFLYMPSVNSSYWLLSAMTAQLAMIVYILMFAAAIRLRYSQADKKRHFKVPGNNLGMWCVGSVGILACLSAIGFGFLAPPDIDVGNLKTYKMILILGMVLFCFPPFLIYKCRKKY